ncbi:hypothetical protein AB0Y21_00265 [Weissella paramesenteroides]|uniref:hypothetical protein n=1 Tax=Weissella paramesenteroides TaxID=1249 RepID=UPI003F2333A8
MDNIFYKFLATMVIGAVILVFGMIKIVPVMISKVVEQNRDYELKRALQIDSYYRQSGSSELQKIMIEWTKMLTDMSYLASRTPEHLNEVIQKTTIYGSESTLKAAAIFFQFIYKEDKTEQEMLRGIVYVAFIVSSLKEDFTGQHISPEELLKLEMKDYVEKKEFYQSTISEIENELN